MPTLWFSSLRKSLQCKTNPSDVHDPKALRPIATKKPSSKSGCSRTLSNLRDVIHGSKRHMDKPVSCSPRSIQSSEFFNPTAHDVVFTGSGCELRISGYPPGKGTIDADGSVLTDKSLDVRRPRSPFDDPAEFDAKLNRRRHVEVNFDDINGGCSCHKCGEKFTKSEALEAHHLSRHAITELVAGDSSRKIVEIICRTSCLKSEQSCGRIQRIYKIHNMSKTLAQFEEYRELIKAKANKLPKKHPRCAADGNELLRFHGTTVACSLGQNGDTTLCTSEKCSICKIIRHGFSAKNGGIGVFTASTSGRALESIEMMPKELPVREALVICRVIAGRVHKPLENIHDIAGQCGFDSFAGKIGHSSSNIEDLYLLNPKALLPCFVVICKT